jgi:hypothetical protein
VKTPCNPSDQVARSANYLHTFRTPDVLVQLMRIRNLLPAAVLAIVLVTALRCATPGIAAASGTQQTILQDDRELIYSSPAHVGQALRKLAALGVDRVKVSVVWSLVAPNSRSSRRPNFDATDPSAYPPGAWDRYDTVVRIARELGLQVYFQFAPPDPQWAVARGEPTRQGPSLGHAPDPHLFGQFVQAVGRRYNGTGAMPRVNYWGIWNEPNERSWLNPWYRPLAHGRRAIIQAAEYRGLVDAAWSGLQASGHTPARDTILIGETANAGVMTPAAFVRALYCVSSASRPLTGAAASALGCPRSGNRRQFVARHPGLFEFSGFAHHPYGFDVAPDRRYAVPTWVTMDNLGSFRQLIARALATYGRHPRGGVQLYLTEWGYKTSPPNPYVKATLRQQQTWLDEGTYMAWRDPYVRAIAQFLLVDDRPKSGERKGSRAYWSTFQTGLEYLSGKPKPAYHSFALPIWLPSARHRHLTVWGQVRPAHESQLVSVELQYQRRGSRNWTIVREIHTRGFLLTRLSLPAAGSVRLAWSDPQSSQTDYSRSAAVT